MAWQIIYGAAALCKFLVPKLQLFLVPKLQLGNVVPPLKLRLHRRRNAMEAWRLEPLRRACIPKLELGNEYKKWPTLRD